MAKCGFDNNIPCDDDCKYYNTCTRNPKNIKKPVNPPTAKKKRVKKPKTCNRDCFNCIYDDCMMDDISKGETAEIHRRDEFMKGFGHFPKGRGGKSHSR